MSKPASAILTALVHLSLSPLFADEKPSSQPREKEVVADGAMLGAFLIPVRPGGDPPGVRVECVVPGSTAESMGMQVGDEVLQLDAQRALNPDSMIEEIASRSIGDVVRFRIKREDRVLSLKGSLGSRRKTWATAKNQLRKEMLGKPFGMEADIVWLDPWQKTSLEGMKGKVTVLVFFNNCLECFERKWRPICDLQLLFKQKKLNEGWLAFAGIYVRVRYPHEKNEAALKKMLAAQPSEFPVGITRFPEETVPPGMCGPERFLHLDGGVVTLDPEGKVYFFDLDKPELEFAEAFKGALEEFRPKKTAPGEDAASPGPKEVPPSPKN